VDRAPASIFEHTPKTLAAWCSERGMPAYRAGQILDWVCRKGVVDPARMTNLSRADRELLAREMVFLRSDVLAEERASDGVRKLLLGWLRQEAQQPVAEDRERVLRIHDGAASGATRSTECVLIPAARRRTACVSSQVGCPVGCRFCASGLDGLQGNLTAGQIVEQVWRLSQLRDTGRVTNVVFMGMGEPLANLGAVERAVRTIAAPWGLGISARRITVSTVGLPAAIERFAQRMDLPVTLALSLHAPTDELRRQLIPWAALSTIAELLDACRLWFEKTGREVTLEYTLLGGVNDTPACARDLARLARRLRSVVNLIRYNETPGLPYARPRRSDVLAFQRIVQSAGVRCVIRASRGRDIAAACGQLRRSHAAAHAAQRA